MQQKTKKTLKGMRDVLKDSKQDLKDSKQDKKQPTWRTVTENIECLAIAVVMALILKFFIIEAYKIPTGSMQPTIMGNEDRGLFDRVLVNKFIYLVSDPKRWDVIVFKYPLDQSKNYIKRLVGLPGEKVTIQNGDIYINDAIERKPESAVNAVMKEVFPNEGQHGAFADYFQVQEGTGTPQEDGVVFGGPGRAATRETVRDGYLDGYDPDYRIPIPALMTPPNTNAVGDLRLSFDVELEAAGGGVFAYINEEGMEHRLFLKGEGREGASYLENGRLESGGEDPPRVWTNEKISLAPGERHRVCFANVDDRLTVYLDGDLLAQVDYENLDVRDAPRTNQAGFGCEGSGAAFRDVRLERDIYYLSGMHQGMPSTFDVPKGNYFVMGDNTQNSADSRYWTAEALTLRDGETLLGDTKFDDSDNPVRTGDGYLLKDVYGDTLHVAVSDLQSTQRIPAHFVPEKLLLGKAMVVFWPIYPYFRWKLLR